MTPAERLILRVVREEQAHPERRDTDPQGYGPYGRAGRRLGIKAWRAWDVSDRFSPTPLDRS